MATKIDSRARTLPPAPTTNDAANFESDSKAFFPEISPLGQDLNAMADEFNVVADEMEANRITAETAATAAEAAQTQAAASANFKGAWSSGASCLTGESYYHNGTYWRALQNSTAIEPGVTAGYEAYWAINMPFHGIFSDLQPMTMLDFTSAQALRRSFPGEFAYVCQSDVMYVNRYGVYETAVYYSGTATSGSLFNLADSLAAWTAGELIDYVVEVTTSGVTEYRWIVGNSATSASFDRPLSIPVDATTTYKLSKPRFGPDGLELFGGGTNAATYSEDITAPAWTKSATIGTPITASGLSLDLVTDDSDTSNELAYQNVTVADDNATHACVIHVKQYGADNLTNVVPSLTGGTTPLTDVLSVDFSTGMVTHTNVSAAELIGYENLDDGVIKIHFNMTNNGSGNTLFRAVVKPADQGSSVSSTASVYAGGYHVELNKPFVPSYAPTTTAPDPTAPDVCYIKWPENAPRWTQPLCFAFEFKMLGDTYGENRFLMTSDTGITDGYVNVGTTSSITASFGGGGSSVVQSLDTDLTSTTNIAINSDGTTFGGFLDGIQKTSGLIVGTTTSEPAKLYLGSSKGINSYLYGTLKRVMIFNAPKSAEAIRLI